jgi:nucleotide-binding universal stress UspA family protein
MSGIVVGVDESDGAAAALRWAAREGELRQLPLTALLAWSFLEQHHAGDGRFRAAYGEDDARATLDVVVAKVLADDALAGVRREVVCDLPAPALVRRAADADLLVVGARGLGGFKELLLGSVSSQCVHHSPCSVAVVRGSDHTMGGTPERLVAGVDGSAGSIQGLRWAADEATARHATLTVVHAFLPPATGAFGEFPFPWDPAVLEDGARAVVDRAVDELGDRDLVVERRIVAEGAATALLGAADGADLLVVGSRGHEGFAGLLLGSVSSHVAHHAACPVVVVRDGHADGR